MGLLFALLAIIGWGVGDFLIQRSTRKFGDWEALFFITAFGTIVLFPFVYRDFGLLSQSDWLILVATSVIILVAALIDFEALRVGKISVVQPVYAMEMPITIALATFIFGEHLDATQLTCIGTLLVGVVLISHRKLGHIRFKLLERGVWYAALAALGMGVSNFLFGLGARETGPLMINWFTSCFMALATLSYLLAMHRGSDIFKGIRKHGMLVFWVGCMDNLAWVTYSASMVYLPIGLATGITESYIALAAVLGIIFNRERLSLHQYAGLMLAVAAAIGLAAVSPQL